MKCGIMQPYLFPYLGYWQLIHAVESYGIYDDVNYFKQGYINRNNIIINGQAQRFSLELIGASQNKLINQIEVGNNTTVLLTQFRHAYAKAPYFNDVFPLLEKILHFPEKNLAKFIGNSIQKIAAYLQLNTHIFYTSEYEKNNFLRGEEKVIHMCELFGASQYINAIGGQELYSKDTFLKHGITLNFISMNQHKYQQFDLEFIPNLSIVDIMMFNSLPEIQSMLEAYTLV
jgi:hypothetical protein